MQKERTDRLLRHMEEFISEECPELNVTQMCGYLIHRVNKQSNKSLAKVGFDIFLSTLCDNNFDLKEAIALMHSLNLSREDMRKMRRVLSSKGIYFPTSNELLKARKKLRLLLFLLCVEKW